MQTNMKNVGKHYKSDQLVAEEAPLVPLYQLTEARLVADSVQNLSMVIRFRLLQIQFLSATSKGWKK